MRLSKIKLAGFKSFVDPTTISLPSNLIGVVGPNGCGKSNVIDAVRWVMGESSAKHLRGDSMADVIFNGSTARKPVGQGVIELVFDNTDGALGGQYANYNEISIKRQIARDGQSVYFLNKSRCRRRDITDVFLGTGLGPRSYSIIEQGMISRVIEAKPEELRIFIEEAAGISKYRARRKETENRIGHTRENLARLKDLRDELGKQLQRLQRQSRTAEKYKVLKEEERLLKAQLLALRWRSLNDKGAGEGRRIDELETEFEERMARQRQAEAAIEEARERQIDVSEQFNQVQARFYAVGADVARLEQAVQHGRERQEQLRGDLQRVEQTENEARALLETDEEQLGSLLQALGQAEPELSRAEDKERISLEAYHRAERQMQEWQTSWDEFNQQSAEPARKADVERTRIQHLEQRLEQFSQRTSQLQQEHESLDVTVLEQEIEELDGELLGVDAEQLELNTAVTLRRRRIDEFREVDTGFTDELNQLRSRMHSRQGRLSSMEALQEEALGKQQGQVVEWLKSRGIDNRRRLAEELEVESGWELAVETVLGHHLEAVCVREFTSLVGGLDEFTEGLLGLFDTEQRPLLDAGTDEPRTYLAGKVRAPWSVEPLMAGIYVADSVEKAMEMRPRLVGNESVITRNGVWLGSNWSRINRETGDRGGVLAREHEIKVLLREIEDLEGDVGRFQGSQDAGREEIQKLEEEQRQFQDRLNDVHRRYAGVKSQVSARKARLDQIRSRGVRIGGDLDDLERQRAEGGEQLGEARQRLEEIIFLMESLAREREVLVSSRDSCRESLENCRRGLQDIRERSHAVALRVEGMRTQRESLENGVERTRSRAREMVSRLTEMRTALVESESPLMEVTTELEQKLTLRVEREKELQMARSRVEELDVQLRELERLRHGVEEQVQQGRDELEQSRMAHEGTLVRIQTVLEQLTDLEFEPAGLLNDLTEEATEAIWQEQVEGVERRISRLGPINLAAIDEFTQQAERKEYLDSQNEDLEQALTTLENAIRRIDRETRNRFKETFDRVNAGLKAMFPSLFGGGHAYLDLTSDDLLETGVTVMARPPGKRNSTIHLLSGGEKALTAVAMVFAIFELNPAPFCLLDEVDAPLDDANVERFCDLVKSMSDRVQFVFITHNKVTMELANHLIGVTMNEPGVSRLVTVDVGEAVEMAAG